MYHIHASFSKNKALTYLHLFEYLKTTNKGYGELAIVEKSLFRLGGLNGYFTPHGDTISISRKEPFSENLNDLVKMLIVTFFETEIQGEVQ